MRTVERILFYLMVSFRGLILMLCRAFMFLFLIGFGLSWLLAPQTDAARLRWVLFALGAMFWALSWLYDSLILKLTPEDKDVALWR